MSSEDLGKVLSRLPPITDPDVLVGFETSDDAAVYRLGDTALVATVDVFTPIVDDPFAFGQIAAANALSDVYAMGARPLFALSIVCFPVKILPLEVLGEILRGGAAKAAEAGIAIVGGHSIDDPEPKFGLSVVGVVDPKKVRRNSTAQVGDVLVLTKAIGTGVLSQGIKTEQTSPADAAAAIASMAALNRDAADAMAEVSPSAATDVTGYGLLGHLHEVVHASGVSARVRAAAVPLLSGASALAGAGVIPGGSRRNADQFRRWVRYREGVDAATRMLLTDAQTSGGLLISVPAAQAEALAAALTRRGVLAARIGEITVGDPGMIDVE